MSRTNKDLEDAMLAEGLISIPEAARRSKRSRGAIRRWFEAKKVSGAKSGSSVFVDAWQVAALAGPVFDRTGLPPRKEEGKAKGAA